MERTKPIGWKKSSLMNKELRKQLDDSDPNEIQYTLPQLRKLLNDRQKAFCHAYIKNGWNMSQAARTAGYSMATAGQLGCQLLKNIKIRQYIDAVKEDIEMLCGISKARQIQEYSKIAYSSISHLHNTWITLKDFNKIPEEIKETIEAIETKSIPTKMGTIEYIKIKLFSKTIALENIDKLLGYHQPKKLEIKTEGALIIDGIGLAAVRKAMGLDSSEINEL